MFQDSSFYIWLVAVIAFVLFLLGSLNTSSLFDCSEYEYLYDDEDDK